MCLIKMHIQTIKRDTALDALYPIRRPIQIHDAEQSDFIFLPPFRLVLSSFPVLSHRRSARPGIVFSTAFVR